MNPTPSAPKFFTKKNIKKKFVQFVILIAHLVLLKWILYTLYEGGILPIKTLLLHFVGMSLYGALLIRICAFIYKKEYLKETRQHIEKT